MLGLFEKLTPHGVLSSGILRNSMDWRYSKTDIVGLWTQNLWRYVWLVSRLGTSEGGVANVGSLADIRRTILQFTGIPICIEVVPEMIQYQAVIKKYMSSYLEIGLDLDY